MVGDKRELIVTDLYTGFAEAKVIAVCPDKEKLEELGFSPEEEPVYTKDKDGVDSVRIDFLFKEVKSGVIFKKAYFLENTDVCQKAKEDWDEDQLADFVPKYQWVNQTGDSQWAADESDLPTRFTKFQKKNKSTEEVEIYGDKQYRIAKVGEADLLNFIKKWQGKFNYMSVNTNILLDLKRLFAGKFSELQEGVGGEFQDNTVELLEVRTVDKEGEVNQYQSVWKESLPGYLMPKVRNTKFTEENISKWAAAKKTKDNPSGRYLTKYEQFAIDVTGEYGSKNFFELKPMVKYSAEGDLAVADQPSADAVDDLPF